MKVSSILFGFPPGFFIVQSWKLQVFQKSHVPTNVCNITGKLPSEEQTQRMKRLNSGRLLEKFGQSVKRPQKSQALIAPCTSHCRRGHTTGHHFCFVFIQTHWAAGEKIIWWGQSNIRPHSIVCLVHLWKVKLDFVNILEIKISQHKQHFAEIWNLFCGQLYRRFK